MRTGWRVFLAAILAASGAGINQWSVSPVNATTITTKTKKSKDVTAGQVIQVGGSKFVKIGDNRYMAAERYPCVDPVLTSAGASKNFDYTGGEQTYTAYADCWYKVEVWGAEGGNGNSTYHGGYGGYSVGIIYYSRSTKLYVNVGGKGSTNNTTTAAGGYNGGGYTKETRSATYEGSGGGATHIASVTGTLQNLAAYKDTGGTNISQEIIIVAGGGAGGSYYTGTGYCGIGGNGGGIAGNQGTWITYNSLTAGGGGTQTAAGTCTHSLGCPNNAGFGKGGYNESYNSYGSAGGGGGWYGGGSSHHAGGGGGSGYIGSSNLLSNTDYSVTKHMTCYNCTTSTADTTRTQTNTCVNATATADCSKTGNGFARITRLN